MPLAERTRYSREAVNPSGLKRNVTLFVNVNAQVARGYIARALLAGVRAEF